MIVDYLKNLYFENPLWQTVWLLAFVMGFLAFLHKKDKDLYVWIMFSQSFWIIHFLIMWLYSWAFVNIVSFARSYIALKYKWNKQIILLFILFYFIIWVVNFPNLLSLLPVLAWILGTFAFLYFSWLIWRIVLLICSVLWLIYSFVWGSIGWIITETFMILAGLITIFRLIYWK